MVEYLDRVQRGFDDGPAPGGGRLLPFWPNDTALTSDDGTGAAQVIYTQILPVQELREIVARLRVETLIDSAGDTVLTVAPQWTIDGNGKIGRQGDN